MATGVTPASCTSVCAIRCIHHRPGTARLPAHPPSNHGLASASAAPRIPSVPAQPSYPSLRHQGKCSRRPQNADARMPVVPVVPARRCCLPNAQGSPAHSQASQAPGLQGTGCEGCMHACSCSMQPGGVSERLPSSKHGRDEDTGACQRLPAPSPIPAACAPAACAPRDRTSAQRTPTPTPRRLQITDPQYTVHCTQGRLPGSARLGSRARVRPGGPGLAPVCRCRAALKRPAIPSELPLRPLTPATDAGHMTDS